MAWFVWLALFIASYFVQRALAPKPERPQPKGLSDFDFPTADGSRALPVVFGTCKLPGPNVVWYGDFKANGFELKGQAAGFYYYLGADLALCHGPVDEVRDVLFEEKSPAWTLVHQYADFDRFYMNATMLFGGNTKEGGVEGDCDFYYGSGTQGPNDYLQARVSADYPGLAHVCHAVMRQTYWGTSEYIKPIAFIVTRCPNGLGMTGGKHRISFSPPAWGYDANPACMIYDILTDSVWGLGLPAAAIDVDSFRAAGETLYDEAFGLAMVFDQQGEAGELIAEILRHIDGDLFADPHTGLLTLALTRAGYDPGSLPVLDESNATDLEFTRGSWSETSNVAKITYTSRQDNFTSRVAQWQNQANLQIRGQAAVTEIEFRGISNAAAASAVAGRVLKTISYPLARLKLKTNRAAWALHPGSVFALDWPPLGISGMACRVSRPAYGELADGKITLEAIEDAFGVSGTAYSDPGSSGWGDPAIVDPTPASAQHLIEAPYQLTLGPDRRRRDRSLGDRLVLALGARAERVLVGFQVWSDPAGGTAFAETNPGGSFLTRGRLSEEFPAEGPAVDDALRELEDDLDLDLLASVTDDEFLTGANLILIDEEIMAWRDVSTAESGHRQISHVMRGVLDTVPAWHSGSSAVWFLTSAPLAIVDPSTPYQADVTVAVKLLPFNLRRVLALNLATAMQLTTASRALKPLPPGKVRINDVAWPSTVTGDAVVTWAHRHRVQQDAAGVLVSQDADDFATAPEGNYTIEIRVNAVLKRTVTGLTSKTWTYTEAMKTADDPDPEHVVSVRITPVNGSLIGNYQEREFLMP